ncbi:MAG: tRNA (adenine-N1)-methyltransferase, partial [Actinomycetota bacterium]|nr:tRNA (adenine-N1)-methyltransferase [Actinomycetota bacterium]
MNSNDAASFCDGEVVMVLDDKRRGQIINLKAGSGSNTHDGMIDHDQIIGRNEGFLVETRKGKHFRVVRPSLSEVIELMPRGAQVIYPKDLGQILMMADIRPGLKVLESGVGSGALSMTLLNAGVDLVGYEIREDFRNRAINNVTKFLPPTALERYRVELRDVYEEISEGPFDRVVLDLPEPWRVVDHLEGVLQSGGLVLSYQTSVGQLEQYRAALAKWRYFMPQTVEVAVRPWHYSENALRPEH